MNQILQDEPCRVYIDGKNISIFIDKYADFVPSHAGRMGISGYMVYRISNTSYIFVPM